MSLINSLHSFFLKISRPATIAAVTVITLLFFWLINFQGVPGIPPIASLLRIGLPDMLFTYSPSTIYESSPSSAPMAAPPMVSSWNASISCSPRSTDSCSLWSPPSAFLVSSPTARRCKNSACFPGSPRSWTTRKTSAFLALLRIYPVESRNLQKLANVCTLAKWTFAAISIVLLLVATLGSLMRNLRRTASD